MTTASTIGSLLYDGQLLIAQWCDHNAVSPPIVQVYAGRQTDFGVCAYYRSDVIHIWPDACARLGRSARMWSWPGYVVDRTPYGVLAHELGHHVEKAHGPRGGIMATVWRRWTGEAPITSYADNDNEWFAEIFRLFVTNPDLLKAIRPKMFDLLSERWPHMAEVRPWRDVLAGSARHLQAAQNKMRG